MNKCYDTVLGKRLKSAMYIQSIIEMIANGTYGQKLKAVNLIFLVFPYTGNHLNVIWGNASTILDMCVSKLLEHMMFHWF